MNFYLTTVLAAIVSCSYGAHIAQNSNQELLALLEEKCNTNAHNNDAFRDLMNSVEPFSDCVQSAMGTPPPHPLNDYTTFCELSGSGNYYTCINNFVKKIAPCLDEDEAYFPNFMLTAYNASYAEFCGENGLNKINAMVNDIASSTCLINHLSLETLQNRCLSHLVVFKNIQQEIFTIKKNDLCSDLRSVKECIIDLLQERCSENHTDTISFLIDPYLAAC